MVFVMISVVHSAYSAEGDIQSGLPRTEAALKTKQYHKKITLRVYIGR